MSTFELDDQPMSYQQFVEQEGLVDNLLKGDHSGHPFRGNQWTSSRATGAGVMSSTMEEGGITITTHGNVPHTGYAVEHKSGGIVMPDTVGLAQGSRHIDAWKREHADELAQPGKYIGGWHDTEHGKITVGIVDVVPTVQQAKKRGAAQDQVAVWDIKHGKEIPTGGTGGYVVKAAPAGATVHLFPPTATGAEIFAVLIGESIAKGDYPGHPFRGNQWSGGGAVMLAPEGRGGIQPTKRTVKTCLGQVPAHDDRRYEMSPGRSTQSFKDDGTLANTRSTISQATNPLTGQRMSNTEMGRTFEELIRSEIAGSPQFKAQLGSGLHHVRAPVSAGSRDSRGSFDLETRTHVIELKSVHRHAGEPKVSMTAGQVKNKRAAARKSGKKGAVLVPVMDDKNGTVKVYLWTGGLTPTIPSGRLQVKQRKDGTWPATSKGRMMELGTIQITRKNWTKAQRDAGWLRDRHGDIIATHHEAVSPGGIV